MSWKDVGENKDGEVVMNVALIKIVTGQFDPAVVTRLTLSRLGIPAVTKCLAQCEALTELDLSYNRLTSCNGLAAVAGTLKRLDLRCNRLKTSLSGLAALTKLEVLKLQGNGLETSDELVHLRALPQLRSLYLKERDNSLANPFCLASNYGTLMSAWFERVRCIDGHYVSKDELNPKAVDLGDDEEFVLPKSEPWVTDAFFKTVQWDHTKVGVAAEKALQIQIAEAKKLAESAAGMPLVLKP